MEQINIKNELEIINESMKDALAEAKSFYDVEFKSIEINPKQTNIDMPFIAKNQKEFLAKYLPMHAEEFIDVKGPVVYYFTITEEISNKEAAGLVKSLYVFKKGEGKELVLLPKVLKEPNERNERTLYVGSKKKDFYIRVCQHLGYCLPRTQGLNLLKWPEELRKPLRFHYCEMNVQFPITIALVEQALHAKLKPLIGESPYYG